MREKYDVCLESTEYHVFSDESACGNMSVGQQFNVAEFDICRDFGVRKIDDYLSITGGFARLRERNEGIG